MLLAGAGNAQAETNPTYFASQDGSLEVIYGGGGMAIYATIVDAHNAPGATEVCHYHITNGFLQFVGDCTHRLKGQTVVLPNWPYKEGEYGGIDE